MKFTEDVVGSDRGAGSRAWLELVVAVANKWLRLVNLASRSLRHRDSSERHAVSAGRERRTSAGRDLEYRSRPPLEFCDSKPVAGREMERAPQHKSSSPTDFANRNINICSPVAARASWIIAILLVTIHRVIVFPSIRILFLLHYRKINLP